MKTNEHDRSLRANLGLCIAGAVILAGAAGCGGTTGDEAHDSGLDKDVEIVVHADAGHDSGHPMDSGDDDAHDSSAHDAAEAGPDAGPPPSGVVTVPLGGCIPGYTATATIGDGTQTFQLLLDTGSTTLGVASTACTQCGVAPLYSPMPPAIDTRNTTMAEYESGNTWTATVYDDVVSLGTPAARAVVALGAISSETQFFKFGACGSGSGQYEGILGFAPAGAAVKYTNGYFDDLVSGGYMPNEFAIQLCDLGGTLWLGGYEASAVTAPPKYVPLVSSGPYSDSSYTVLLSSIGIKGTSIPMGTKMYPDSILDTGTSLFVINSTTYNTLTADILADSSFQSVFGTNTEFFDKLKCKDTGMTKANLDAELPPLTLVYGTGKDAVSVTAVATESYLESEQGSATVWCGSLYSTEKLPEFPFAGIVGSPALKSAVTVFDRAGNRVGFAPHAACP